METKQVASPQEQARMALEGKLPKLNSGAYRQVFQGTDGYVYKVAYGNYGGGNSMQLEEVEQVKRLRTMFATSGTPSCEFGEFLIPDAEIVDVDGQYVVRMEYVELGEWECDDYDEPEWDYYTQGEEWGKKLRLADLHSGNVKPTLDGRVAIVDLGIMPQWLDEPSENTCSCEDCEAQRQEW